ncbi:hypothetical protein [Nocardia inohanensis]|uniref:hypothetical protein n=1 Tax=Nocardia inohanensis TaxID=209246 RepID=UPI0012FA1E48|nr:hypothetical protein [Nocardia inohanensis]
MSLELRMQDRDVMDSVEGGQRQPTENQQTEASGEEADAWCHGSGVERTRSEYRYHQSDDSDPRDHPSCETSTASKYRQDGHAAVTAGALRYALGHDAVNHGPFDSVLVL